MIANWLFGRTICQQEISFPTISNFPWLNHMQFSLEARERRGKLRLSVVSRDKSGLVGSRNFVSASQLRLLIIESDELGTILTNKMPLPRKMGYFAWFSCSMKSDGYSVRWVSGGDCPAVPMDIERLQIVRNNVAAFLDDCQKASLRD